MFKGFPSLHPFAIHFPIVLILLAAGFQAVLVWKDWKQIRWATLLIMVVAFGSALAASTIFHAEPSPDAPKAAMEMFEQHEKYASLTVWMSGITLLLKSIGVFFKLNRRIYEVIVLVSAIIASIFLSIAGHHGARLTHIAGIGPMGRYLMKEHGMGGGDMKNMNGTEMKGDSNMKMNNKMEGMDTMQNMKEMKSKGNMKDTKGMDNMKGKDNMKDMKGMGDKKDMKNMKGKDNMKGMKGMDNMKDMKKGKDNMKDMKGMEDMKDMKGKDNMKDMKGMKDMQGMDSSKKMGNMKNMDMPENKMEKFRFPDNNPALKKSKKTNKQ